MDSPDSSYSDNTKSDIKKKRVEKACDLCCRRKIKCNGAQPCNNCIRLNQTCLYERPVSKKGRPSKMSRSQSEQTKKVGSWGSLSSEDEDESVVEISSNFKSSIPVPAFDFDRWDHSTFLTLFMTDSNGTVISFFDFYFLLVHPRLPIFNKTWFLENIQDLPLYILFGSYLLGSQLANNAGYKINHPIDSLYKYCQSLFGTAMADNSPLTIVYSLSLGYTEGFLGIPSSCATYFAMAIRLCQVMGLDKDKDIVWTSSTGRQFGTDVFTGKDFTRNIFLMCFIQDFYISAKERVPCLISKRVEPQILLYHMGNPFDGDVGTQLSYRIFFIPLLEIGKKIHSLRLSKNREISLYMSLDIDLTLWYKSLPQYFEIELANESKSGSTWLTFLILCYCTFKYWCLIPSFMQMHMSQEYDNLLIQKLKLLTSNVNNLVFNTLTKKTGATATMPFFFLYSVGLSALIYCVIGVLENQKVDITHHVALFNNSAAFYPMLEPEASFFQMLSMNNKMAFAYLQSRYTT